MGGAWVIVRPLDALTGNTFERSNVYRRTQFQTFDRRGGWLCVLKKQLRRCKNRNLFEKYFNHVAEFGSFSIAVFIGEAGRNSHANNIFQNRLPFLKMGRIIRFTVE